MAEGKIFFKVFQLKLEASSKSKLKVIATLENVIFVWTRKPKLAQTLTTQQLVSTQSILLLNLRLTLTSRVTA